MTIDARLLDKLKRTRPTPDGDRVITQTDLEALLRVVTVARRSREELAAPKYHTPCDCLGCRVSRKVLPELGEALAGLAEGGLGGKSGL